MQFLSELRDRIRLGEITCSVRLWQRSHVKVGGSYSLPPGHIVVTAVTEMSMEDVTPALARQSGFAGVVDLLKTAKHGPGRRVFLIGFRYEAPKSGPAARLRPSPQLQQTRSRPSGGGSPLSREPSGGKETSMVVESCIPVIPSADLKKSLRFWVKGLGLTMDRAMRRDGTLIGCMVHGEQQHFWLNQRAGSSTKPENYEGIRLYWAPRDLRALRARLRRLGYTASEITDRDYGQTEFFVTDDDGYSHCFGVASNKVAKV